MNSAKTKRLLIVDDEPMIGELVSDVARTLDFETKVTTSPEAFRREFDTFNPTHASLDLEMPGEGGVGLIMWLKDKAESPKIILMSGNPALLEKAATMATNQSLPVVGVLTKPARIAALRKALEH